MGKQARINAALKLSTKQPVLAVTHLEGGSWEHCVKNGANAVLFVGLTTPPNSVPIALLVNDGTMSDHEAEKLMRQAHSQYGTKLYGYLNLKDLEETVVSHTQGALGAQMAKFFPIMLEKVGIGDAFRGMLRSSTNPAIQAMVAAYI